MEDIHKARCVRKARSFHGLWVCHSTQITTFTNWETFRTLSFWGFYGGFITSHDWLNLRPLVIELKPFFPPWIWGRGNGKFQPSTHMVGSPATTSIYPQVLSQSYSINITNFMGFQHLGKNSKGYRSSVLGMDKDQIYTSISYDKSQYPRQINQDKAQWKSRRPLAWSLARDPRPSAYVWVKWPRGGQKLFWDFLTQGLNVMWF